MKDNQLIMKQCCAQRFATAQKKIKHFIEVSEKETILVAIDGKCASGKTTLGYYLKEIFDCNLFHMDDFFLQEYQRSQERLLEVGGNVDYERFLDEVIQPVMEKKDVTYRPLRCSEMKIDQGKLIPYRRINIIEGSYSMHPYFGNTYDVKIFMDISDADQLENIMKRNGERMLSRFKEEWIPKENAYFEKFEIEKDCIKIGWR